MKVLSWERKDPDARVLEVVNCWPHNVAPSDRISGEYGPRYGVYVKRQVDSFIDADLNCDVLFIRGFESHGLRAAFVYVVAALYLFVLGVVRKKYRLVHVHSGVTAFSGRFYLTAPVIVTYYGDDLLGTPHADGSVPSRHRLLRRVQRAYARFATRTITQSVEMERTLSASVQRRNLVIPSGIDPTLFLPMDRDEARRQLGWSTEDRVALFAADPKVPRKRYWLAQRACERAAAQIPNIRLRVATDVEPNDIPLWMSAADCLLLTSAIEGSPNVVKESVWSNLPVITTYVGDVESVLADVEPSWICGADSNTLAEALVECLAEPQRSSGRATADWLSSDVIAQRHLDLYEELAPGSVAKQVLEASGLGDRSSPIK